MSEPVRLSPLVSCVLFHQRLLLFDFSVLYIQRISIGYIVAALCEIWLPCQRWRGVGFFRRYYWQWCIACALLVVYLWLSYGLFVPDWKFKLLSSTSMPPTNGSYVYTVTCSTRGDHGPACNAAGMIDHCVLGLNHLYTKPVYRNLKDHKERSYNWCIFSFSFFGIGLFLDLVSRSTNLCTQSVTCWLHLHLQE